MVRIALGLLTGHLPVAHEGRSEMRSTAARVFVRLTTAQEVKIIDALRSASSMARRSGSCLGCNMRTADRSREIGYTRGAVQEE